jgi:cytochrome c biogenesis protein CcmG/thiol:disulfide interchange protein DsbE
VNRQSLSVVTIIVGLILAAFALTRYASPPEGAQVGRRAPDYAVERVGTSDTVGLRTAFRGHVTLVNVWATWCAPCRAEMPAIERVYQQYRDRGFRVAAVSIDDGGAEKVTDFTRELGLTFDVFQDRSGLIQQAYQTIGVPESFLLDARGRITYLVLGERKWDTPALRARIESALDGEG